MFTTHKLREAIIQGDVGEPITLTSLRNQATDASPELISVPRGQVGLITTVTLQAGGSKIGITSVYDPALTNTAYGFNIVNEAAQGIGTLAALAFRRPETYFMGSSTPTARSAPPGNTLVWNLKHPIPVPSGCDVVVSPTFGEFGNHASLDLVLVDAEYAAGLGINVNADATTSRCRLFGALATSVADDLIPGREGLHIRLKDVLIRMQAATATANVLRVYQVDPESDEETNIFRFVNNNVVDALDIQFSPDEIFLKAGAALWVETTVANSASVTISAEYASPDDVDANAWFACANPIKPGTTDGTAVATGGGNARKVAVGIDLYYPKNGVTASLPGMGKQHLVRGVAVSAQKSGGRFYAAGSTMVVDETLFTISQGTTSGEIGLVGVIATEAQTNQQIIPVLYATEHDQNVLLVDDNKNAACVPNDGKLWINAFNFHNTGGTIIGDGGISASVTTTDADISAWSFMLWGRTIPNRFRTPALRDS